MEPVTRDSAGCVCVPERLHCEFALCFVSTRQQPFRAQRGQTAKPARQQDFTVITQSSAIATSEKSSKIQFNINTKCFILKLNWMS